jgi:hypothetical protein
MRAMNLDTLVRIGQPPWRPVPTAEDVDVWDKYDFPTSGTYRLGDKLIVFTLITTAGTRSIWAYVPVPPDEADAVSSARFDTEAQFNAFLEGCFAGHEVVFAAAEDFVITTKSDGTPIPPVRNALLVAAAEWYIQRAVASQRLKRPLSTADETGDTDALLRATQGVLANLPA